MSNFTPHGSKPVNTSAESESASPKPKSAGRRYIDEYILQPLQRPEVAELFDVDFITREVAPWVREEIASDNERASLIACSGCGFIRTKKHAFAGFDWRDITMPDKGDQPKERAPKHCCPICWSIAQKRPHNHEGKLPEDFGDAENELAYQRILRAETYYRLWDVLSSVTPLMKAAMLTEGYQVLQSRCRAALSQPQE